MQMSCKYDKYDTSESDTADCRQANQIQLVYVVVEKI